MYGLIERISPSLRIVILLFAVLQSTRYTKAENSMHAGIISPLVLERLRDNLSQRQCYFFVEYFVEHVLPRDDRPEFRLKVEKFAPRPLKIDCPEALVYWGQEILPAAIKELQSMNAELDGQTEASLLIDRGLKYAGISDIEEYQKLYSKASSQNVQHKSPVNPVKILDSFPELSPTIQPFVQPTFPSTTKHLQSPIVLELNNENRHQGFSPHKFSEYSYQEEEKIFEQKSKDEKLLRSHENEHDLSHSNFDGHEPYHDKIPENLHFDNANHPPDDYDSSYEEMETRFQEKAKKERESLDRKSRKSKSEAHSLIRNMSNSAARVYIVELKLLLVTILILQRINSS